MIKFCKKHIYKSKKDAATHRNMLSKNGGIWRCNGKVPVREYYCEECKGWHLTHCYRFRDKIVKPTYKPRTLSRAKRIHPLKPRNFGGRVY